MRKRKRCLELFMPGGTPTMKDYRMNRFVQIGFWLLVTGAGSLVGTILLDELCL